ncbi:hypothetical protein ABT063_14080 [Streptomyces sp. NPDC002838]|uniref:hypothetical protein n=1 Tax=Streptomyces sp. NPDC002838 TaxID=3154436 RepID=UPI00332B274F
MGYQHQGSRDHSVGDLISVQPSACFSGIAHEALSVRFVSGRVVEVVPGLAWEWKRADALVPGDRIPFPLLAGHFGIEGSAHDGYFVGAMLGDGGMTSCTPECHDDSQDGAVEFMRSFATERGCGVRA